MVLIAVPNLSEGTDPEMLRSLRVAVHRGGARVLDVHTDAVHNRSVLTLTGTSEELVDSLSRLGAAAAAIDMKTHTGVHPRLGGLDVCPIVPHSEPMQLAIETAHRTGRAIAERAGTPVYFYGYAASRPEARELPALRKGGLKTLQRRAEEGFSPDAGPAHIDSSRGVVCVGARDVLIAFNVWITAQASEAKQISARIRESAGGLPGVRALGLAVAPRVGQVSMNLTRPDVVGIDEAFEATSRAAREVGAEILATEIVGLVPRRFMPDTDAQAARLLMKPGRSLESALES
jgi:glutamate formiminotransferase / 5-formyltetrahydrofolate cyclo-ligase